MVTLVRVLSLLVCGLTLTPPGVCFCHVFEPADTAPHCPCQNPDQPHPPSCPAAEGGKQLLPAEPSADVGVTPMVTAFVGGVVLPIGRDGVPSEQLVVRGSHSPPLYLSHCALVL